MKLRFTRNGDQISLLGIAGASVPQSQLSTRFKQAEKNWALPPVSGGSLPVFVGCEHLATIPDNWDSPFILIEKSSDYFEFLQNEKLLKPHPMAQIILGDIGFAPVGIDPQFSYAFIEQEMCGLARCLLKELSGFESAQFRWIFADNPLDVYDQYLYRTLLTTNLIHKIHQTHLPQYAALLEKTGQGILVLHKNEQDYADIASIAASQFQGPLSSLNLEFAPVQQADFFIFKGEQIPRDQLTEKHIEHSLAPALTRFEKILAHCQKQKPESVCMRNQSIYGGFEDELLLNPLWQRCGVKSLSFWVDYQGHQFSGFEGGFLHAKKPEIHEHHLSLFALDGLHHANARELKYYTHPYGFDQKPLAIKSDTPTLDIAILHTVRLNAFKVKAFNTIFQMLEVLSDWPLNVAYYTFFDALRNFFDAPPEPFKRVNFWVHLINTMDFAFYHQVRIHYVKAMLNHLSPHFSVKVFGDLWPQIIDPQFCAPYTKDPASIYNSSRITLNLSPIDSYENPPFGAANTLTSGGLPVCLSPAFKNNSGLSIFNEASFSYATSPQDVWQIVSELKQNPKHRAELIQTQTDQIQSQLLLRNKVAPSDYLAQLQPLKRNKGRQPSFTNDPLKDQFILFTTLGFLFELSGFFETALELWQETTSNLKISFKPLIAHAQALADQHQLQKYKTFFEQLA